MIVPRSDGLSPAERAGLDVLIDLSRLLPAAPGLGALVLEPSDGGAVGVAGLTETPVVNDGVLRIPRSTLATIHALTSAAAEQATAARDRLGRVPSSANTLVESGAEGEPIVSRYAVRVREAAKRGAGDRPFRTVAPWPDGRRWAVAMSHDLDVVALWPVFTGLRVVELLQKGELGRVARSLGAAALSIVGDPIWRCVTGILKAEAEAGVRSTWFILCGTPTWATFKKGDLTYRPESQATRRILAAIDSAGHELGLHGSMETAVHPERFAVQRERLRALAPKVRGGVRQHFLRMDPGPSQGGMVAAGFEYDATWGFSDRNAFRLGVADVVPWGDGALDLAPFCWMDRTQSKYQGIEDPGEWVAAALAQASRCREVEGMWSGIWHPNLTDALGYPGSPEAYRSLVNGLMAEPTAWSAPLAEIVAWRRRRRAVRGVGVGSGGEIAASGAGKGAPLFLEDATGAQRERVAR